MIYFRAIQDIKTDIFNQDFDEIWFCVNSIRSVSDLLHKTPKIKWIPELAPDDKLFSWYKERKNNNEWNAQNFYQYYVPLFLKSISKNESRQLLNYLISEGSNKNICICCFCVREMLCHRSILKSVLFSLGGEVECP